MEKVDNTEVYDKNIENSDEHSSIEEHSECSICMDKISIPIKLPCKHDFCYLCLKAMLKMGNDKCPLCRCIVPQFFMENAMAERKYFNFDEGRGRWMYSGRNNGWWYYDDSHNKIIEESYRKIKLWDDEKGPKPYSFKIEILSQSYTIDLLNNTQTNDSNGAVRSIKYDKKAVLDNSKGVAGLKYCEKVPEYEKKYPTSDAAWTFNPHYVNTYLDSSDEDTD